MHARAVRAPYNAHTPQHAHTPRRARARLFILSFGLQYPLATTKAWLHATLLHLFMVNFLFAPLKIWFFAVTLPLLIRGKLQRLKHPKRAIGSFPFRTPMRDSAVDYLAAQHAHLPIAKFLLHRQGLDTSATGADGSPPPLSVAPNSAPILEELLHLGATQCDGGDNGGERSAISASGRISARSHRLRRRTCGATLALVALSLVMFMPEQLQGFMVDEVIVMLVSLIMVAALEAASTVRAHTTAVVAVAIAAGAVIVLAGISVPVRRAARLRRTHRRAEEARLADEAALFLSIKP